MQYERRRLTDLGYKHLRLVNYDAARRGCVQVLRVRACKGLRGYTLAIRYTHGTRNRTVTHRAGLCRPVVRLKKKV